MGVSYNIPHQSRFIPTTTIFHGLFNNPTVGMYNFDTISNQDKIVIPLIGNTIYLIDRVSIGGDISELNFQNAILNNPLMLSFRRGIQREIVYSKSYPIVNYIDDQDFTAWIYSTKSGDDLTLSLKGLLKQTNDLIGVDSIRIFVNLSIYAIDSNKFSEYFKSANIKPVGII